MQETRQHILEILKEFGQATVDEIVAALQKRRGAITAVTVRHHLTRLQQDHLIAEPELLHRSTPGRPQHVYALTEKAREHFPNNHRQVLSSLIHEIHRQLPPHNVNVILEGTACRIAAEARIPNVPLRQRLDIIVDYLNHQGYNAYLIVTDGGYILHTANCPYHTIAESSTSLCEMDARLIEALTGVVPRLLSRINNGDMTCSYMIPENS